MSDEKDEHGHGDEHGHVDEHKHEHGHGSEHEHGHGSEHEHGDHESEYIFSHHDKKFDLGHHSIDADKLHHLKKHINAMTHEDLRQLREHVAAGNGRLFYSSGGNSHHFDVESDHHEGFKLKKHSS